MPRKESEHMKRTTVIRVENANQLLATVYDLVGAGFKSDQKYWDYVLAQHTFENLNVKYVTVKHGRIQLLKDQEFYFYVLSDKEDMATAKIIDFADLDREPSELFRKSLFKELTHYDWVAIILTVWAFATIYFAFKNGSLTTMLFGGIDLGIVIAIWLIKGVTYYLKTKS